MTIENVDQLKYCAFAAGNHLCGNHRCIYSAGKVDLRSFTGRKKTACASESRSLHPDGKHDAESLSDAIRRQAGEEGDGYDLERTQVRPSGALWWLIGLKLSGCRQGHTPLRVHWACEFLMIFELLVYGAEACGNGNAGSSGRRGIHSGIHPEAAVLLGLLSANAYCCVCHALGPCCWPQDHDSNLLPAPR
jgi:hypothetical protein